MNAATSAKRRLDETKVLAMVRAEPKVRHVRAKDLEQFLLPGDVLVVNRSATMPSSFLGVHERSGKPVEIRLASFQGKSTADLSSWFAVAFGSGDWRTATEERPLPPLLQCGDVITMGDDLRMTVEQVDETFNRLIKIKFHSKNLIQCLYQYGRPIQYSYLKQPLEVWDQQTLFAGPPISVEPPSAAFALTWRQIFSLQKKGVVIASILHGAGISSSGSEPLDAKLPLAEWYEVPEETVAAIKAAKKQKRRIVALGTTVARALESAVNSGGLQAGAGFTNLKLGPKSKLKVVTSLISGLHAPGTSHLELSKAFCSQQLIERAYSEAQSMDYRDHEFGDLSLLSCV